MAKVVIAGNFVDAEREFFGQVEINTETGLIEKVSPKAKGGDYDLGSALIFPGFVDVHVHAREDASGNENYKEDYATAGKAALSGGVVHFADMPNNPAPPLDEQGYAAKTELARKSPVGVTLYAGVSPQSRPLARKVPYKVYLGKSVGQIFFNSRQELVDALEKYHGQAVSFHVEDPEILASHEAGTTHEQRRPAEAEVKGIEFALKLIEKFGLHGKICHVSTAAGLGKVQLAKKQGLRVTCEVTPHHLFFAQEDLTAENRKLLQVNPPIRSRADREALLEGLRRGVVDYLASDHAPHTLLEKQQGVSGVPNLDTYGAFVTWLLVEKNFSAAAVARFCARNPGDFVNEFLAADFGRGYGQIAEGFAASFTVINLDEPTKIETTKLKTKCGWSPFSGVVFPGRVAVTIVRGKVYQLS